MTGGDGLMTGVLVEQRVRAGPDLVLPPLFWNYLLPETTGYALWLLFVVPALMPKECQ